MRPKHLAQRLVTLAAIHMSGQQICKPGKTPRPPAPTTPQPLASKHPRRTRRISTSRSRTLGRWRALCFIVCGRYVSHEQKRSQRGKTTRSGCTGTEVVRHGPPRRLVSASEHPVHRRGSAFQRVRHRASSRHGVSWGSHFWRWAPSSGTDEEDRECAR